MPVPKRLGIAKDQRNFVYTYTDTDPVKNIYQEQQKGRSQTNLLQQTGS
jgi:hypothetical protein